MLAMNPNYQHPVQELRGAPQYLALPSAPARRYAARAQP
jgi:hypothetical protein